jgi:hypothetical protein
LIHVYRLPCLYSPQLAAHRAIGPFLTLHEVCGAAGRTPQVGREHTAGAAAAPKHVIRDTRFDRFDRFDRVVRVVRVLGHPLLLGCWSAHSGSRCCVRLQPHPLPHGHTLPILTMRPKGFKNPNETLTLTPQQYAVLDDPLACLQIVQVRPQHAVPLLPLHLDLQQNAQGAAEGRTAAAVTVTATDQVIVSVTQRS